LSPIRAIEKVPKDDRITTHHAYRFVGKPQGSRGNFGAFAFSSIWKMVLLDISTCFALKIEISLVACRQPL
jgi:hypothetical protein